MSRSKNPLIDLAEKEEEKFYYLFGENEGKLIYEVREAQIKNKAEDIPICKKCPFKETYKWVKIQ